MNMWSIIVASIVVSVLASEAVEACEKSTGKTAKDKAVAEKICDVFKPVQAIEFVSVQESILYVDISEALYRELRNDRVRGPQLVRKFIDGMQAETGKTHVTVWIYWDKEKVIEGDVSLTGEKRVKYLDK